MPMPTPLRPEEEPTTESELYRYHFRRLITWYLEALDPLPEEAFAWRPPLEEANPLSAICAHAIASAAWGVLSCVGDGPLERDRDAEFAAASTTWAQMRPRFTHWLEQAEALVAGMGPGELAAISRHPGVDQHPGRYRMNRRCLLHAVEHLGLHLGQVEITVDWWKSAMGKG
jgi:hypothetical protein